MKTLSPAVQETLVPPSSTTMSFAHLRNTPAAELTIRQPSMTYLVNLVSEPLSSSFDKRTISFQSSLYWSDR